jgi:flagellar basal body-associated protein FliL
VIPVLVNLRREELLSPASKNLIRRRITEQLNSLPLNGKIIQILFTDLTIEDARS